MKRVVERLAADPRAVASLEFSIVSGLFVFITLGIVELGLVLWTWNALETTAALTARCAAIGAAQCSNPQQFAVSAARFWIFPGIISTGSVAAGQAGSCNGLSGTYEVVTITSPLWSGVLPGPFALSLTVSECYPINPNALS